MKNLTILCLLLPFFISNNLVAQTTGDYRTAVTSVTWSNAGDWQTWDGTKWATASSPPGLSNDVYVQAGHTATLTGNQSCNALYISTGTIGSGTGGDGKVALQSNTLNVNGKLSCYYGIVRDTVNSTAPLSITASSATPSQPISKSSGGILKFVGDTRNLTASGEWGGGASGSTTLFDIEIALNSGQTGTLNSIVKAANWIISSGTLETTFRISADNNTAGQGDITIADGATLSSSASSPSTPVISRTTADRCGTLTINGTLKLTGLSPHIDCSSFVFGTNGTVEFARAGNQNFINKAYSGSTSLQSYKNIKLSGTGTKTTLDSLATDVTANGSLIVSGGALAVGTGATFSVSSTGTTLFYSGSSAQTATSTEWLSNFQNLTITNSAGVSIGGLSRTVNGTLTLTLGTFSNGSTLTLGNGATIIRTGGTLNSAPTFGSSVNVTYNQYGSSISTGNELPSSSSVLYNLTINNSNGVSLSASRSVNGVLTLTSGLLTTTSSNLLTIETSGSVTGFSNSSFINGPMAKNTAGTSSFTFPTGKGSLLRTISITPSNSNSTTYTAEYFNSAHSNTSSFSSPITRVSTIDYFDLTRSTSGSPADAIVGLAWGSNSGVNTSNVGELTIARFAGGNWVNESATGSGNSSSGTVTSNSSVSSFGSFVLANATTNNNLLPVKFLYFRASSMNPYVSLQWATATEINCMGFEVQKSENGIDFNTLEFVKSKSSNGNSYQNLNYSYNHYSQKNEISFFRLKQLDYDGEFEYSTVIKSKRNEAVNWMMADQKLSFFNQEGTNNWIEISDLNGRLIYKLNFESDATIDMSQLPSGLFLFRLNHYKPIKIFNQP